MLDLDPALQAELESEGPDVFWGLEIPLGSDTVRLAERPANYFGDKFTDAIHGVTPIASAMEPEARELNVEQLDVVVDNFPGALPGGTRFSHRFDAELEASKVRVDLFAYTEHELDPVTGKQVAVPSSLKRQPIFVGVPRGLTGWTPAKATMRLQPYWEQYAGHPICETITDEDYGFARLADIGKAIPCAFGFVEGAVGRVTKAAKASLPVSDPANVGTATLDRPIVNPGASARDYTVTITPPETVEFTGPADVNYGMGIQPAVRLIRAQSFQTVTSRSIAAVKLNVRRVLGTQSPWCAIYANSGGQPGAFLGRGFATVTSGSLTWVTFSFASPIAVAGSTTYWIVFGVDPSTPMSQSFGWGAVQVGGYATGLALIGEAIPPTSSSVTWSTPSPDAGLDHLFQLVFAETALGFEVTASPGGAAGNGIVGTDFTTSGGGEVTIPDFAWSGSPAAGDVFTFSVDPSDNEVIFAESPSATPCLDLANLRINGSPAQGGTTVSQTSDDSLFDFGEASESPDYGGGAQGVDLAAGIYISLSLKLARVGMPEAGLRVSLRAQLDGPDLWSTDVEAASLSTTSTVETYPFEAPFLWTGGAIFIVLLTDGRDDAAYYRVRYQASTDPYAGGTAYVYDRGTGSFRTFTGADDDLYFVLTAATVTLDESAADYSGRMCALAHFSVDIPDSWEITADVLGNTDDADGTYTGTAASLITIPADAAHYLAAATGLPREHIDVAGSFAAARAAAGSVLRVNGLFETPGEDTKHGLLRLADQNLAELDWSIDRLEFRDASGAPEVVATITWYDVLKEDSDEPTPRINSKRTDFERVLNTIRIRYGREWSEENGAAAYRRIHTAIDQASVAAFGERSRDEEFLCEFVTTEQHAAALGAHKLDLHAFPGEEHEVALPLGWIKVKKGEGLRFNLAEPSGDTYANYIDQQKIFRLREHRIDLPPRELIAIVREV